MTRMKIAKYIPAAALALVLAGCQSEDDFISSDYANDPMAVHIRAGIEALQTRVNTTETGDAWENGDLISVANTSKGAVQGKDKAVYKYNGSTWEPEGTDYMVWADDVNTFEAYYPVVEGKTDSYTQFELPADQSSSNPTETNYIGRADYMTAAASQSKSDALNLTFKHHLTKVTVKISGYGNQYATQKPVFQAPTFTLPTTTTTVDGKKLTVAGNGTTVTGLFSEDASTEAKHSFTAVLLPSKYATNDTFVKLNIQGGTSLTVLANVQQLTGGLESGKAYTFNVTVGKDYATINSVTVENWGNGWTEYGTADEETGPKVNADTHTISLSAVGQLNAELIGQALNGETTNVTLTISGPMNENDIAAIQAYLKSNSISLKLDLGGATELTVLPGNNTEGLSIIDWPGLVSIVLPEGLTTISQLAFQNCTELTSVTLPSTLETINWGCFAHCTGLTEIELPSSLKTLEYSAFFGCTGLTRIDLSQTQVTFLQNRTFSGCTSLQEVILGNSIKQIGSDSFYNCTALTTIDLALCDNIPTANFAINDWNYAFENVATNNITVYVKNEELKNEFASSFWATHEGFSTDKCVVK